MYGAISDQVVHGLKLELVDPDGNFVGMNSYPSYQKMTPFIQRVLIHKQMVKKGIVRMGIKQHRFDAGAIYKPRIYKCAY